VDYEPTMEQPMKSRAKTVVLTMALAVFALVLIGAARRRMFLGGSPGEGTKTESLEYGGLKRTYLLHVSASYNGKTAVPLLVVLHGATQSPAGIERLSEMSQKADEQNFVVVYPSGTGRLHDVPTWNSGNCCGYAMEKHIDDIGFLHMLIDELESDYAIDRKRVYVTGISNGGMMSYRVGCELSDKVAAIAPVEGALNVDCKPAAPVSVIVFHGTADHLVPFDGGSTPYQLGSHRSDNSVADAVAFWAKRDGCAPDPKHEESTKVHTDLYSGCKDGTAVALYAIQGGHHSWPGDHLTPQISATDTMLAFFAAHPKQ
jgi:polyhydroxybutyrate depolymerase